MLLAIVLTLNEEKHLSDCLRSLSWTDEVWVFDSFSTDKTTAIAESQGVRVLRHHFENYAAQRNAALQAAREHSTPVDWVLFIDADERVPAALAAEIRATLALSTQQPDVVGWWLPRHNYLLGKLTRHAGWYPDYQLRLLQPNRTSYDPNRTVHELVLLQGSAKYLQQPLVHINYETVAEFIQKQYYYARLDAHTLQQQGQRAKPHNFILQPLRQFWWRYVTLQGWRMGWHGLRLSGLLAYFQYIQYGYLWQANQNDKHASRNHGE